MSVFIPKQIVLVLGTLPSTGKSITLSKIRSAPLSVTPITSRWGSQVQDEGYEYSLKFTASHVSANYETDSAGNDLQEWAENQYPVLAEVRGTNGVTLYWYEVVTMSEFSRNYSGNRVQFSMTLSIRTRRPRVNFDKDMAERDDTGFLPIVAFGNPPSDRYWINRLRVIPRERSNIFEYIDGTRMKEFFHLYLEFQLEADAFEILQGAGKVSLLNILRNTVVRFYPIWDKSTTTFYNVLMPREPGRIYGYDRGVEDRSLSLTLQTASPLLAYPSWLETAKTKVITTFDDHEVPDPDPTPPGAVTLVSMPDNIYSYGNDNDIVMREVSGKVFIAAADLSGADWDRGALYYDINANTFATFQVAESVEEKDAHFQGTIFAEEGKPTTHVGAFWPGSSNTAIRHDHLKYFVSGANEGLNWGSEKQIDFSDDPWSDITVCYANIFRVLPNATFEDGLWFVCARFPQQSTTRHWGYKYASTYPFEPGDFSPTLRLFEGSRWNYIKFTPDYVNPNYVHVTFRSHGSQAAQDGDFTTYYGYINFLTGDLIGKQGVVGNLYTHAGLPFTDMSLFWRIPSTVHNTGEGWIYPTAVIGRGSMTPENPVVIPYFERDEHGDKHAMVAVFDGSEEPALIDIDREIELGLLAGAGICTLRQGWIRWFFQRPGGDLIEIRSHDNFQTWDDAVIQSEMSPITTTCSLAQDSKVIGTIGIGTGNQGTQTPNTYILRTS